MKRLWHGGSRSLTRLDQLRGYNFTVKLLAVAATFVLPILVRRFVLPEEGFSRADILHSLLFVLSLLPIPIAVSWAFFKWMDRHRMFEGLVGHSIVALVAIIVASGVYEHLATRYFTAEVRAVIPQALKDAAGKREGHLFLRHIRDGSVLQVRGSHSARVIGR